MVKGIREALVEHLTAVLGNDQLAAQFMLLHLLSRVIICSSVFNWIDLTTVPHNL